MYMRRIGCLKPVPYLYELGSWCSWKSLLNEPILYELVFKTILYELVFKTIFSVLSLIFDYILYQFWKEYDFIF